MFNMPWFPKSSGTPRQKTMQVRPSLEVLEGRDLPSVNSLAPMPPPWVQTFHGDFNGDGKQDVAGIDSSGQWWVSLSTGTSFTARTKWAQWSVPSAWTKLFVADVNGDGKDDIVGFGFNGDWFVGISNGTDTFATGPSWAHWSSPSSWDQLFLGDFNGDGKADIAGFGNNGAWFVGLSNGTNAFATGAAWAQWSAGPSWSQLFVGDFNGDGKADIAGFGNNGAWFVGLSNGTNAFATGAAWAQWSHSSAWSQLFVGDVDGDGKADIIGFAQNSHFDFVDATTIMDVGIGVWFVGVSNGVNSFSTGDSVFTWSTPNNWAQLFVADFNGDGAADFAGFATTSITNITFTNTPAWNVAPANPPNHYFPVGSMWVQW
jgi:hypothetical protein